MFSSSGPLSCSCARPGRVGWGKQEENVECRKSLSKNTRSKKNFGELRRATVWLVPQAERRNAEIPFHSHTLECAFHENSMLSGEICGVACWVTFTLRAFLRFQLRLSFSPATQTHAIGGKTWKTPTEAFHRRKRVLKVNGFLSIPHFARISLRKNRCLRDALVGALDFCTKCKISWTRNWKTFATHSGSCFSERFRWIMKARVERKESFNASFQLFKTTFRRESFKEFYEVSGKFRVT